MTASPCPCKTHGDIGPGPSTVLVNAHRDADQYAAATSGRCPCCQATPGGPCFNPDRPGRPRMGEVCTARLTPRLPGLQ